MNNNTIRLLSLMLALVMAFSLLLVPSVSADDEEAVEVQTVEETMEEVPAPAEEPTEDVSAPAEESEETRTLPEAEENVEEEPVQLRSPDDIVFTTQPADTEVEEDKTVSFKVAATGDGAVSFQWYYSDNGGVDWSKAANKTTDTYSFKLTAARNGRQVKCLVKDTSGNEKYSDVATATIKVSGPEIVFTMQPANAEVEEDKNVSFKVAATGDGAVSFQWYYSDNGGVDWSKAANKTTDTYSFKLTAARNGRQVKCLAKDTGGNEKYSDVATATIKVSGPEIVFTMQPANAEVEEDKNVSFKVAATGDGAVSYQWYYSDNGGSSWTKAVNKTTDTYSFKLTAARNGRQVKCLVKDAGGNEKYSDVATATIKVSGPEIVFTTQPANAEVEEDKTVSFNVAATGDGAVNYQWYYSDNGGSSWTKAVNKTTTTYSFKLTAARNGRQVKCLVKDAGGNEKYSDVATATIKVIVPIVIIQQPVDVEAENNTNVTFTVEATGDGLTYRWKYSDDNGVTFRNTVCTAATYTWKLTEARNGRQVKCVITDANGQTEESDVATATIKVTTFTINDVVYDILTEDTCFVAKYNGTASTLVINEKVTIPDTETELTVVEIGVEAFMNNTSLKSIDLPDTITVIRARAFKGCTNLSEMK